MSWNYRIIARKYISPSGYIECILGIHEVYYHKNGKIKSWTLKNVGIVGETIEELRKVYKCYGMAFEKPILYETDDYKLTEEPFLMDKDLK